MKKIVTVRIEVDMSSPQSQVWENPKDYFENEVDDVLRRLSSIGYRPYSKYSSEEGITDGGSQFKVCVK
jgi:hypothetical protein